MSRLRGYSEFLCLLAGCAALALLPAASVRAGGGMVLSQDTCIIWIDFYSVHFTAYQPATRGNEQFCRELPETGDTLIVLDYLHPNLKDVPVELRIVHDFTGQGRFVKLQHLEGAGDLDPYTVFYQPPVIRPDASLRIELEFLEPGPYIAIVSAGHPDGEKVYTAVFPFEVGTGGRGFRWPLLLLVAGVPVVWVLRRRRAAAGRSAERSE